jgi:hypothetical protein
VTFLSPVKMLTEPGKHLFLLEQQSIPNTTSQVRHLSFDEKTLFFESDQPGGFGQHDLYVSYWDEEKKTWGPAINLGPTINTEFEEKGVFFHPDNKTLYFSSNGHNTMGGLDIFKTVRDPETGEWSKPENIGYPINTPDDDIYFVVTGDERYAYYSSYREDGFGEKDIYKITFLGDKKDPLLAEADILSSDSELFGSTKTTLASEFDDTKLFVLKGTVVDGKTKVGISTNLSVTNAKTNEKVTDIITNSDGTYSVILVPGRVICRDGFRNILHNCIKDFKQHQRRYKFRGNDGL